MRNPARFRFQFRPGDSSRELRVYWLTPSGSIYRIGLQWFPTPRERTAALDLSTALGAITFDEGYVLHNLCMYQLSLRPGGGWIARDIEATRVANEQRARRRFSPHALWRHNLSREERQDLGALVGDYVRTCQSRSVIRQIINFLNEADATPSLLDDSLATTVDDLRRGDCGHWHHWEDGGDLHGGGTICHDCCEDYDNYRQPEDDSDCYYPTDDLYRHPDGDYYTYAYESDDDDDEDSEDDGESGSDGNPNDRGRLYEYSTDIVHALEYDAGDNPSSPTGPFTIGVELEVYADEGERSSFIDVIHAQIADQAIIKADGSLDSYQGCEIVTLPMPYEEQVALFAALDYPSGTTAWDNGQCGMHVHIDSRAFTALSIAKFLDFWNHEGNIQLIRYVAGRHPDRDERAQDYARRVQGAIGTNTIQRAKAPAHSEERYRIVNLCNVRPAELTRLRLAQHCAACRRASTVEIRIFRATLKKTRQLAQIEMAAASVYFARDASIQGASQKAFIDWLRRNHAPFPHLAAFLGVRPAMRVNPTAPRSYVRDETHERPVALPLF